MKCAALTALASLALAAPAAATPMPADEVLPADVLAVARAQWPESPCAGREQVDTIERVIHNGQEYGGWAYFDANCHIEIAAGWLDPRWRYDLCVLVTHEFGHLAGWRQETIEPGHIMNGPNLPTDFAPCLPLTPEPATQPVPAPAAAPAAVAPAARAKPCRPKSKRKVCRRVRRP